MPPYEKGGTPPTEASRERSREASDHQHNGFTTDSTRNDSPHDEATQRTPLRDRLLNLSELAALTPPQPLVEGFIYQGTLAQLSATAGSYKTFLSIAIACSVATGRNFDEHQVPERKRVIYAAAEGASGLLKRIYAWCELNNVDPHELEGWLHILPCPIQLGSNLDVHEAEQLAIDIDAGLVILDTRSKCTIGLEENSNTEQAKAVNAAERIISAAGSAVLVIHHNGRSGSTPRGATAWDGGVWSDLRMEGGDLIARVHCEKHKDAPSGCDHHFRLIPRTVSEHLMSHTPEDHRKTLVIVQNNGWTPTDEIAGSQRTVLDVCRTSAPENGFTTAQLRDLAADAGISRSSAYTAIKALVERGLLKNIGTDKTPRYVPTAATT